MSEEFKIAFNKLSINDKRNQISNELLLIGELIKSIESKYEISNSLNIKNYDITKDIHMTEDKVLTYIYENIYSIQRELITILSAMNIKG